MKYVLYHGESWSPGALAGALGADQVELHMVHAAASTDVCPVDRTSSIGVTSRLFIGFSSKHLVVQHPLAGLARQVRTFC